MILKQCRNIDCFIFIHRQRKIIYQKIHFNEFNYWRSERLLTYFILIQKTVQHSFSFSSQSIQNWVNERWMTLNEINRLINYIEFIFLFSSFFFASKIVFYFFSYDSFGWWSIRWWLTFGETKFSHSPLLHTFYAYHWLDIGHRRFC